MQFDFSTSFFKQATRMNLEEEISWVYVKFIYAER